MSPKPIKPDMRHIPSLLKQIDDILEWTDNSFFDLDGDTDPDVCSTLQKYIESRGFDVAWVHIEERGIAQLHIFPGGMLEQVRDSG